MSNPQVENSSTEWVTIDTLLLFKFINNNFHSTSLSTIVDDYVEFKIFINLLSKNLARRMHVFVKLRPPMIRTYMQVRRN